jgi:hypothetical protein
MEQAGFPVSGKDFENGTAALTTLLARVVSAALPESNVFVWLQPGMEDAFLAPEVR